MKRLKWMGLGLLVVLACSSPPPPGSVGGPEPVGDGALFKYRNSDAKKVYLVGDFNDWSPISDAMTDENGDGNWTLFYPLKPGRYAYKFVVDGRSWIADPTNPDSEADGFDGRNSILTIPAPES
jgi:1,4-alpha-glucan branching enzyme